MSTCPGKTDWVADGLSCSTVNVPKRARATTSGHRSAAQNGQYSAPTNRTSGLPAGRQRRLAGQDGGRREVVPGTVTPTASKVEVGTDDRVARTAGEVTAG